MNATKIRHALAVLLATFIIITLASKVLATDDQTIIGIGDTQTCMDGDFNCAALQGADAQQSTTSNITINVTLLTEYDKYSMNDLVYLVNGNRNWWNPSWQYRQQIRIQETNGITTQNPLIQTTIDTATLITAGKMRSDCADLRVITKDGLLTEYTVHNCNSASTTINTTISSLPMYNNADIYIYYGKPSASDASMQPATNNVATYTTTTIREEQYGTSNILYNTGNTDLNATATFLVEQNVSGSFVPVSIVANISIFLAAQNSTDISALWNATGWNTTLAGSATYKARLIIQNSSNTMLDTSIQFLITDSLINITIPVAPSVVQNGSINLSFIVNSERYINSCETKINGALQNATSVDTYGLGIAQLTNLPAATVNCNITCSNNEGRSSSASTTFTVVKTSSFAGETTNLATVNISNITNLTVEDPGVGKIKFTQQIDLSAGADLDAHITIAPRTITVDSAALTTLNTTAVLTFYNLNDIQYPIVYRDGVVCPECSISSFSAGTLNVNVLHFSSYTIGPNSKLVVYDSSDSIAQAKNTQIIFTANYTNVTSNNPITGAICNVTFADIGTQLLTYNISSQTYEYNRSFNATGVYPFTMSCSAPNFDSLNVTDYASITDAVGPIAPTNVTVVQTSRGTINNTAKSNDAIGGNTTEINIESIHTTDVWQGVYGNLTGEIQLTNAQNEMFYKWNISNATGEVYASRASDVNFATIGCAQDSNINDEDSFLGTQDAIDAVNQTFIQKNHPTFKTGNVQHTSNSCPSTNTFTASGQDLNKYYQVLLVDGANNTVYTSIIEHNATSFNNKKNDFQMLVPSRPSITENYFYWVEIN